MKFDENRLLPCYSLSQIREACVVSDGTWGRKLCLRALQGVIEIAVRKASEVPHRSAPKNTELWEEIYGEEGKYCSDMKYIYK